MTSHVIWWLTAGCTPQATDPLDRGPTARDRWVAAVAPAADLTQSTWTLGAGGAVLRPPPDRPVRAAGGTTRGGGVAGFGGVGGFGGAVVGGVPFRGGAPSRDRSRTATLVALEGGRWATGHGGTWRVVDPGLGSTIS